MPNIILAKDGKAAVYVGSDADDEGPFDDPQSNISSIHWHSELPSPAIIKTSGTFKRTGSFTLPALGTNTNDPRTNTLFAHGKSGTPFVFGKVVIDGQTIYLNGSVPIVLDSAAISGRQGFGRWLHLGADTTNVMIRSTNISGNITTLAAVTIDWEIYVTDLTAENGQELASTDLLNIEPGLFVGSNGRIDSRKRYIREDASSPLFKMVQGKTVDLQIAGSGDNVQGNMRYSLDGYTQQYGSAPGSFVAAFTDMTFEGGNAPPAADIGFIADADAGYIAAWDTDGTSVFDTRNRNFVWTDGPIEGSLVIPARTATSQFGSLNPANHNVDSVISSINSAADTVFGVFRATAVDFDPMARGGWFQATGTYLNGLCMINNSGNAGAGNLPAPPYAAINGGQLLTFRAVGGQLLFNERTFLRTTLSLGGTLISVTFPTTTIDYHLYCGTFV